jgi:isopentenyl phosphate kinase
MLPHLKTTMLIFLKLGGSLITDKTTPRAVRRELLARLMQEIAEARAARPGMRIVLGHGSGSFGHVEARRYGTRAGVRTDEDWLRFAEVQSVAGLLNRLVVDAARAAGLPIFNCPPSASALCEDGRLISFAVEPVRAAVEHGLIPLVYGDVAVDAARGGTIISTEDEFRLLAPQLGPERILLAGIEPGVLTRWPDGEVIPEITTVEARRGASLQNVGTSHAADVTGGMESKVREMLALVEAAPDCAVQVFSGEAPGQVRAALLGEAIPGTLIRHG